MDQTVISHNRNVWAGRLLRECSRYGCSMAQSEVDAVGVQIAGLAADLLREDDAIAALMVERICAAVPLYDTESVVSRALTPASNVPGQPPCHLRTDGPRAGNQFTGVP
jgi:hypothetical protein